MFNRYVSLVARLCLVASFCLALGVSAFGQTSGYLFQLPGANSQGSFFSAYVYDSNNLGSSLGNKPGPQSASQVIAKPDGTKFYFIGTGSNGVQSIDAGFNTFSSLNGIKPNNAGTITAATITPDGKYLLVGGDTLYIIDTSSDTVLANTANITGNIASIAVSKDSKTAWVLTNSAFGGGQVIAVDLIKRQRLFNIALNLPFGGATSIVLSPLGLLYVGEPQHIYEIDPATFTITSNGDIAGFQATPGNLHFSPDGLSMYFVNLTPNLGNGGSILKVTLATHAVNAWPTAAGSTPPAFFDCYVVSSSRILAFAQGNTANPTTDPGTLWEITASPLNGAVSQLPGVATQSVTAMAISNELPSARFLYTLIANGNQTNIDRFDLASNTLSTSANDSFSGIFQFVAIPPQTGASFFLPFNQQQQVKANTPLQPLIARVLDSTGRPLNNIAVTFATDPTNGVVIATPSQVSNSDGYVQTTVTVPNVPGQYTITLTAGGATTTYTLTVPGAGVGGGGGPGTFNQVTIVQGDGQLIQVNQSTVFGTHLTVKVTDANGKALTNEIVNFSLDANGQTIGNVSPSSTVTDTNGIAFADFSSFGVPQAGQAFQQVTITATTADNLPPGPVFFAETVFNVDPTNGRGQPEVHLLTPVDPFILSAGQGQALPSAITAAIYSTFEPQVGAPIPKVGIRLADSHDHTLPSPATCQGDPLSDASGVVTCTPVATCVAGPLPQIFDLDVVVGEYHNAGNTPIRLTIGQGQAATLQTSQGNNQSGKAGDTLPQTLYAVVTDPCGGKVAGVPGAWTIVSGDAKLVNPSTKSDSGGRFGTNVLLGQAPGPIQIQLTVAGVGSVTFSLTNNVVVTSVSLVSGSGQTGFTNAAFPQPVVFQVRDGQGNPIPGITVTFNIVSGSASINPATLTTDAQGRVATTVTAGATAGSITISASAGGQTATASVTSQPPGLPISPTSFFNAAADVVTSAKQIGLVPCGLASAQGNGLALGIIGSVSGATLFGPLQYTLNGLSISVNGVPAPILSLSNSNGVQQVNFQTPCETAVGQATVVIQLNGGTTTVPGVQVLPAQPGIFNFNGSIFNNATSTGKTYGAVYSTTDGSLISPSNPAHRGGTYYMFATGLGLTNPPALTNASGTGSQSVAGQVALAVNGSGVPVNAAIYSVGYVGIYTITFTIPTTATPGTDQSLSLGVNGVFSNQVLIPAVN